MASALMLAFRVAGGTALGPSLIGKKHTASTGAGSRIRVDMLCSVDAYAWTCVVSMSSAFSLFLLVVIWLGDAPGRRTVIPNWRVGVYAFMLGFGVSMVSLRIYWPSRCRWFGLHGSIRMFCN
ncbi:hypothetical protein P170DRAFT_201713 [Aspergillus steynii IBT 23096]|uniref:Uncharacterized protein n=1 Tax=Aspergillus steynii IBT 23096 TaxID=1392250 RepID=A0A2I2G513_9EURO|nr:uncharacterized protein P170DRAFT_201713 [Aspergillus steynii IBT 23096]PLB47968.1 hypothetical protein P170DRAFT_201713 [Aspergillus steynii IBT 23096]